MMLRIREVLTAEQLAHCQQALAQATWTDGRMTAGHAAIRAKHNQQLATDDPVAQRLADLVLKVLGNSGAFMTAALPLKVLPPRFNRYAGGGNYDQHVDNAVMNVPGTAHRIRTDISATLFLSDPQSYQGGELVIEDTYGSHSVKLPAGDMVLYPASSLHRVTPVTGGERLAAFFWVQSMVRDDGRRGLLFELDQAIQSLSAREENAPGTARLHGVYHNLLRQWTDT